MAETYQPGGIVDRRFRVVHTLGTGAAATVYCVEDSTVGQVFALKLVHPQLASADVVRRRVVREVHAIQRIRSPNVVQAYESGSLSDGTPFLLMEMLEGQTLRGLLRERGTLSAVEAKGWVLQAAEGLCAAHAAGVVHRDVKPDNLMLVRERSELPAHAGLLPPTAQRPLGVKVLDFGIAALVHHETSSLTRSGQRLGTYAYMAPEQMRGARGLDERVDVYSLGVVLYELLAGRPPFTARTPAMLAQLVAAARLPSIRASRPDLPAELDTFFRLCLARPRDERLPSMWQFRQRLRALPI